MLSHESISIGAGSILYTKNDKQTVVFPMVATLLSIFAVNQILHYTYEHADQEHTGLLL